MERRLLVRHQRARTGRGASRGRWRCNRHDHRGHSHHHPVPPGRLADDLPQRGACAWPRGRRCRPVPASAQPVGDRRDAGAPDRESTHRQRFDARPEARLRRDPARLVRLVAYARLPCPAAARARLRAHPDHRRWAHLRHRFRRHVRAPAGGALSPRPWGVSAHPVDRVRPGAHVAQFPGHAQPLHVAQAALPRHAEGPDGRRSGTDRGAGHAARRVGGLFRGRDGLRPAPA